MLSKAWITGGPPWSRGTSGQAGRVGYTWPPTAPLTGPSRPGKLSVQEDGLASNDRASYRRCGSHAWCQRVVLSLRHVCVSGQVSLLNRTGRTVAAQRYGECRSPLSASTAKSPRPSRNNRPGCAAEPRLPAPVLVRPAHRQPPWNQAVRLRQLPREPGGAGNRRARPGRGTSRGAHVTLPRSALVSDPLSPPHDIKHHQPGP